MNHSTPGSTKSNPALSISKSIDGFLKFKTAEFLAIVHALALFTKRDILTSVYTDSVTAITWVKKKKCKSTLIPDDKNSKIFELILRAEDWLQNNETTTTILKWDTEAWGEIPADYGRK